MYTLWLTNLEDEHQPLKSIELILHLTQKHVISCDFKWFYLLNMVISPASRLVDRPQAPHVLSPRREHRASRYTSTTGLTGIASVAQRHSNFGAMAEDGQQLLSIYCS